MNEEKVYCPYCGPWNGHPNGVEMVLCKLIFDTDYWYQCPVCRSSSPMCPTKEEANAAALRRCPSIEQIKWERDTAIKQLLDDYGVGFGEKKPMQNPLELQELLPGNVVWMDEQGKVVSCVHLDYWDRSMMYANGKASIPFEVFGKDGVYKYPMSKYGKVWRCWLTKPTDEERAAAPWDGE